MGDLSLESLRDHRYPDGTRCSKCQRRTRFHRIRTRSAFGCQYCGHQVYPAAGTIFHRSTQPLATWEKAIRLVRADPGITSRDLADRIGVSYKTAWRMRARIREYLAGQLATTNERGYLR